MSEDYILGKINWYEGFIQENDTQIGILQQQISDLNALVTKLSNLTERFESKQAMRVSGLNNVAGVTVKIKSILKYHECMQELLTGSEYRVARSGLDTAKGNTQLKISQLEGEIGSLQASNQSARNSLSYWYGELQDYYNSLEEEVTT